MEEIGNYALCGEGCLFDQADAIALLRATIVNMGSSSTRYPPSPLRPIPTVKKARQRNPTPTVNPVDETEEVSYIRVGKYKAGTAQEGGSDERVISDPIVVAEVKPNEESLRFLVVDVFTYNNVDIGECNDSEEIEDWTCYAPDDDFENASCSPGDRLERAVLQIAKTRGRSRPEEPVAFVIELRSVDDSRTERFTVTPLPLPRQAHFCYDPPPITMPPTSKDTIEALVVFHDWAIGEDVLAIHKYVYCVLEWNDSYSAFEAWLMKKLKARTGEKEKLGDYLNRILVGGWRIDVAVLLQKDGSLMTYSWTDHPEDVPKACLWLDNRFVQQLGRRLYIDVYIEGDKRAQAASKSIGVKDRLIGDEEDSEFSEPRSWRRNRQEGILGRRCA